MNAKYPHSCDSNTEACALTNSQIGTGTSLKFVINVIPQILIIGTPLLIVPITVLSLPIYTIDPVCNNVFIPDSYYGCCGHPVTRYPTKSPVLAPTSHPAQYEFITSDVGTITSASHAVFNLGDYTAGPNNFICGMTRSFNNNYNGWIVTACRISDVTTHIHDDAFGAIGIIANEGERRFIGCNNNRALVWFGFYSPKRQHFFGEQFGTFGCSPSTSSYQFVHDECKWSPDYDDGFAFHCDDVLPNSVVTMIAYTFNNFATTAFAVRCCSLKRA